MDLCKDDIWGKIKPITSIWHDIMKKYLALDFIFSVS